MKFIAASLLLSSVFVVQTSAQDGNAAARILKKAKAPKTSKAPGGSGGKGGKGSKSPQFTGECASIDSSAVAFYSFDADSTIAENLVHPGRDDAVSPDSGMASDNCRSMDVPDAVGKGLALDLASAPFCVPVVNNPTTALTDLGIGEPNFTIQFWAKNANWDQGNNGNEYGLVALSNNANTDPQFFIGIEGANDNANDKFIIRYALDGFNPGQSSAGPPVSFCTDNAWCHIAVTVEYQLAPQAGTKIYWLINGMLRADAFITGEPLAPGDGDLQLFIGTSPPAGRGQGFTWPGSIDEVGIYNKVLSARCPENTCLIGDELEAIVNGTCSGFRKPAKSAKSAKAPKSSKAPKGKGHRL